MEREGALKLSVSINYACETREKEKGEGYSLGAESKQIKISIQ